MTIPPRTEVYTGPSAEDLARVPAELKARTQWVLWRGVDRVNPRTGEVKFTKIPIDAQTLTKASSTDAETWQSLDYCLRALPCALEEWEQQSGRDFRGGGVGYVFAHEDPFSGIDLDGCRQPGTSALAPWARDILTTMDTYSEVSPSGTGVKLWVIGMLPPGRRKTGQIEMYSEGRFFTVTGWRVPGTAATIGERQDALTALHHATFGTASAPLSTTSGTTLPAPVSPAMPDEALLTKIRQSQQREKFTALWSGLWESSYESQSQADLALVAILIFWTQDATQLERLFNQSGFVRDKWSRRPDYRQRTIRAALMHATAFYQPQRTQEPPDPVDTWLGPRSTWFGVPRARREVTV